eukprot:2225002-Pleurochrysis_carterae.AAC.1
MSQFASQLVPLVEYPLPPLLPLPSPPPPPAAAAPPPAAPRPAPPPAPAPPLPPLRRCCQAPGAASVADSQHFQPLQSLWKLLWLSQKPFQRPLPRPLHHVQSLYLLLVPLHSTSSVCTSWNDSGERVLARAQSSKHLKRRCSDANNLRLLLICEDLHTAHHQLLARDAIVNACAD